MQSYFCDAALIRSVADAEVLPKQDDVSVESSQYATVVASAAWVLVIPE